MSQEDIFSTEHDTIDLSGIDAIIQFTRYKPHEQDLFLEGLELAEDLTTDSGTLYTEGTEISPERIARLLRLRESNPNLKLSFKIKRSAKLIQTIRNDITGQMTKIFKRRQGNEIYRNLFSQISKNIKSFIDEILSEEKIILAIYKMKFICESSENKKSTLFFNHSLNIVLISLAIAKSENYADVVGDDKVKLVDISKVGLFHNYGALTQIDKILKTSEDKWFQQYCELNQNGYFSLGNLQLGFEIMDSIRFICEYYMGRKDFINRDEWPAIMANIVLVADTFLQKESGLFGTPHQAREIVDQLNVQVMEKELNEKAVQALTTGLNMKDIFDFYQELDKLIKECIYDTHGVPYPITGFKSPTLFICKDEIAKCEHIEKSLYAVRIIKSVGELEPKKYRRCWLLSRRLNTFYKEHYKEIKHIDADKEKLPE